MSCVCVSIMFAIYPSGSPEFTPGSQWGSCYLIFSFICMLCRSLFVLLYFFFWPLCCLFFFDIRILITPLVSSSSSCQLSLSVNEIRQNNGLKRNIFILNTQHSVSFGYYLHIQAFCLSSFMTYHRVCNQGNPTGAISGAETGYPPGAHQFIPVFCGFVLLDVQFFVECFVDNIHRKLKIK